MLGVCDRLSCAVFGLANTVTIMFYTVENSTKVCAEGVGLCCRQLHARGGVCEGRQEEVGFRRRLRLWHSCPVWAVMLGRAALPCN